VSKHDSPRYEVHPATLGWGWGVYEHAEDEPAFSGIGSRQAAEDLAEALNRVAAARESPASG
jgi:hypothetical protein